MLLDLKKIVSLYKSGDYSSVVASVQAHVDFSQEKNISLLKISALCAFEVKNHHLVVQAGTRICALFPNDANSYNNVGRALFALGRYGEAEKYYLKTLSVKKNHQLACYNLCELYAQNENKEKLNYWGKQLVSLSEKDIDILSSLVEFYFRCELFVSVVDILDKMENLYPNDIHVKKQKLACLALQQNLQASEEYAARLIADNKDDVELFIDIARFYERAGNLDKVISVASLILKQDPRNTEALLLAIRAFSSAGRMHEAQSFLFAMDGGISQEEKILLSGFLSYEFGDFSVSMPLKWDKYSDALREYFRSATLFYVNYFPGYSSELVFNTIQQNICSQDDNAKREITQKRKSLNNRKLRIGYISPDFRIHACRFFYEEIFHHHSLKNIELFAYYNKLGGDEYTTYLKGFFDKWRNVGCLSDRETADLIDSDEIDVLIDLAGHTSQNALGALAFKPAPIQITYLGYGSTTGLEQIDYFIADKYFVPVDAEPFFSERILRMKGPMFCYKPAANTPDICQLPALKNGYITFGTLSRVVRLNDCVLLTWAKILQQVPNSRLIIDQKIFRHQENIDYMYDRLKTLGMNVERIELRCTVNHWESYQDIDISLDPFPHNGGTTIFESLWMGVPVLSKVDRPSVGRFGASILTPLGMENWLAETEAEYTEKAVLLSRNVNELDKIRSGLRSLILGSSLTDGEAFVKDLEGQLFEIAQQELG